MPGLSRTPANSGLTTLADPGYEGAGTGIRAGEKKFGAPDEVRTGAPSPGSNELREILGIIIILIGTNSFPDI